MSSIWTMKKQELVEELEQYEVLFSSTDTVGELRQLLKEVRAETRPKMDNPAQGLTALKKQDLLEKAANMGLQVSETLNRSQLIATIREHLELSAAFDSQATVRFGKYKMLSVEEVYQNHPEYVAWVQDNVTPASCYAMKRLNAYVDYRNQGHPPTTTGAASSSHAPSTPEPGAPVEHHAKATCTPKAPTRVPAPKAKSVVPPHPPLPKAKVQSTRRTREEPIPGMDIDATNRLERGTETEMLQIMRSMMQRMANLENQVQAQETPVTLDPEWDPDLDETNFHTGAEPRNHFG